MPSHLGSRRLLRAMSALTLVLGTGLAAPLVLATTADARASSATAALGPNGRTVLYTAASGQTNKATVTASKTGGSPDITYVIDDVVRINAGTGCTHPSRTDHTKVSCTVTTVDSQDPYAALEMDLGDGNDAVTYDNTTDQAYYFASVELGTGNDKLTDTGAVDGNFVGGQAGDDTITVGDAATVLSGDGNDTVHASGGGTVVQGGKGNDTVYSSGDTSYVEGGAGNDVIHGGADTQHLSGDDGDDTISGGSGYDFLYGGKGNDVLRGNSGDDSLYGNSGDDTLYGGPGNDTLSGGPGTDVIHQN